MVRRYKKTKKALLSKIDARMVIVLFIAIALVGGGVNASFTVFSSDWGIDVELVEIGYDTHMYPITALPSSANVLLSGTRIVTLDYDGRIDWDTATKKTINVLGEYDVFDITPTTPSMMPMVSHAVGNLFYSDASGNRLEVPIRVFEETGIEIGNVHYYFGFSVMFTTRADAYIGGGSALMENRNSAELGWFTVNSVAPYAEIDARTVVSLNLQSLSTTFEYDGVINSVEVVNQRARYTLSESISGVSPDMNIFNLSYDWLPHNMKGSAQESMAPIITNPDVTEARIEMGAKLAIGIDSPVSVPFNLEDYYATAYVIDFYNSYLNAEGYDLAGEVQVYNVEYIYDLVIDVSLNGIPLADFYAEYAKGTHDALLEAGDPELAEIPWVAIFLIAVVAGVIIVKIRF